MNFVDEGIYFEASNLANELCKEVSREYDIPEHKVKNLHIKRYMEEIEAVSFLEVSFGNQLDKLLLGAISKVFGEVIISINKSVMFERQLFTCMHEVGHYYFDLEDLNKGNQLTDMIYEDGYLSEDLPREFRANVVASVLMSNDKALKYAVCKFKTFNQVADYFFMSKSAFRVRLTEYLMYHHNCSPDFSYQLVNDFCYSKGNKFKDVFLK